MNHEHIQLLKYGSVPLPPCSAFRIYISLYFIVLMQFFLIAPIHAQSRKDLIWEYKKMIRNDADLGFSLAGDVTDYSNAEISAILERAWTKKKTIILLQILGYLANPDCVNLSFHDRTIENAMRRFRSDFTISDTSQEKVQWLGLLTDHYRNSGDDRLLPHLIRQKTLIYDNLDILLIGYKNELELQLWVKDRNPVTPYLHIKTYDITSDQVSAVGPKSVLGDQLTPEGFYSVNFYPALKWSDFYLAFRVTYPNDADMIRRRKWGITGKAGGDINIHGCCVSIGCLPIGNKNMEELYLLLRANQKNGGETGILIFPFNFHQNQLTESQHALFRIRPELYEFWQSLEAIHFFFIENYRLPQIGIDPYTGYYYTTE